MLIQIPFTVLHCVDILCTTHIIIESLHDSIMHALLNAANSSIPFTRPHLKYYKPNIAGWNVYVKTSFVDAYMIEHNFEKKEASL